MKSILIRTAEDVAALARDVRTGRRRRACEIRVRLKGMERDEAHRLTREINKHYFCCGCSEATASALIGLAAGGLWVAERVDSWRSLGWEEAFIIAGSCVLATWIGRAFGRWRDRQFLVDAVDRMLVHEPDALDIRSSEGSARCQEAV